MLNESYAMRRRLKFCLGIIVLAAFVCVGGIVDRSEAQEMKSLSEKEEKIVAVCANAARGDLAGLKESLASGLDAGASVEEWKEILVQVYAYCGFPRSLNALGVLMTLVDECGNMDDLGKKSGPLPNGRSVDFGTENQTRLCGAPVKGPLFEFAPAIDEFLKAHLFGDIFARDNLDWRTRELATIAMLAALPGAEPQRDAHIAIGKKNGLTDEQIQEILAIVRSGESDGSVAASRSPKSFSFALGAENSAFAQYFSGKSYLAPIATNKELGLNVPIYNVTFEPGCRNNWHSHTGGQILIAVGGVGYYQERGRSARRLAPGDCVEIPKDVEHWHGAAPGSWFSHLAVECNPQTNKNTWLEPVSDAEYVAATSPSAPSEKLLKVRLAKIRVVAEKLDEYNAFLKEEIEASLRLEPGVRSLYAVADKNEPARITILEIYADEDAYQNHLQTPHFQKYKVGVQEMVEELKLLDVDPLLSGATIER